MEPITGSAARLAGSSLLRLQSDDRLAKLAPLGNRAAFEVLVRRYRGELVRACSRILDGAAEDAVQQALLKAHQALLRNGPPDRFRPWLHKIALNSCLEMLSREAETVPIDDSVDGVEPPDEVYERRERMRSTVGAISGLPAAQRRALILRELEGRSHEEIARDLGLSPGAARQLIYRARNSLRSAASALTPPALLLRLLGPGTAESANRAAEIAAGGAAGGLAAKAAVTAIVAGGLAGAAAVGPLDRSGDGGEPNRAEAAAAGGNSAVLGAGGNGGWGASGDNSVGGDSSGPGGGGEGSGSSGRGESGSAGHSGLGGGGSDDASGTSGSGGDGSGESGGGEPGDDEDFELSDSGSDSSGSGSSGSSGSGSGSSGSSGPGSSGSGLGSSGSGSPESDSSGSGSSGSDSSGNGSSGSGSEPEPDEEPHLDTSGSGGPG